MSSTAAGSRPRPRFSVRVGRMIPLACFAASFLSYATGAARRETVPCDDLAIELTTGWVRLGGMESRLHRLRFNLFEESASESLGQVSWDDRPELTRNLWNEDLV